MRINGHSYGWEKREKNIYKYKQYIDGKRDIWISSYVKETYSNYVKETYSSYVKETYEFLIWWGENHINTNIKIIN